LNKIVKQIYNTGAKIVLEKYLQIENFIFRNLKIPEIDGDEGIEKIESLVIDENLDEIDEKRQVKIIKELLNLNLMKLEGEKVAQYEEKVIKLIEKTLE